MEKKIEMLKAENGDCFLIKYNEKTILIDGGTVGTYTSSLKNKIRNIESIDLLIVTHIDDDHINGIKKIFEDNEFPHNIIKKVWFNSGSLLSEINIEKRMIVINENFEEKSVSQAIKLEEKLNKLGCWEKSLIKNGKELKIGDIVIKVIAPCDNELNNLLIHWDTEIIRLEKERVKTKLKSGSENDYNKSIDDLIKNIEKGEKIKNTVTNESSIVILIEIGNKKILFAGDSSSNVLVKSLTELGYSKKEPLKLDLFKLPHHGSKFNLDTKLLEMIDCKQFLISTNGSGHNHPDKECLVKLIRHYEDKNIELNFNYDKFLDEIFSKEDKKKYSNFKCFCKTEIDI